MDQPLARRERRWFQRWFEAGLDVLLPLRCAGCGEQGVVWCPNCDRGLRKLAGRLCWQCGLPLRSGGACRSCRVQDLPLPVRSYAWYEGPLVRALVHLKYRPDRRLATQMGGWLAEIVVKESWDVSLIVPVPLSRRRYHQRGYNQASLIARGLAKRLHLPLSEQAIVRVRDTPSQVGLDPVARWRNVEGAFRAEASAIRDQRVLLVDDLFTTGATLAACAHAVLEAGCTQVCGLTVGRATRATDP